MRFKSAPVNRDTSGAGPAAPATRRGFVLGSALELTDYAGWWERCLALTRQPAPVAVEFANTQVITMRRHEPQFRAMSQSMDYTVPDATPLVWCLNRRGARLQDRVYGPLFFQYALRHSPAGVTHYFLGGSEECGAELRRRFQRLNPHLVIAGSFHGKCDAEGRFGAEDDRLRDELQRLAPDFLWVGLGTPKQQAWIHRNKPHLRRGVLLSIGQAFDVSAGLRPDAPPWMQRCGLTWLFRLGAEPRRLLPRYLKYNSLFLFYLFRDGLRGRALSAPVKQPL
jgi:N-acetylglucosaminyldiphosphoundecaprenol N-acetyl-beta-D-mannosaminyltransferase